MERANIGSGLWEGKPFLGGCDRAFPRGELRARGGQRDLDGGQVGDGRRVEEDRRSRVA